VKTNRANNNGNHNLTRQTLLEVSKVG
jgi:hypothetical protein